MVLLQEAIMKMKVEKLIKNKIELSLCKMEADLKRELKDNMSSPIEIKFGKDEESCNYIIKINNDQIKFTIEDITKALMESSKPNEYDIKTDKQVKIV